MTIGAYITVKIINLLVSKFKTYVKVLNKKVWNKITLSNQDILLKSLKKKEICITRKTLMNNIQSSSSVKGGQGTHAWVCNCQG